MSPDERKALALARKSFKQADRSLYYLNEYPHSVERFRIESRRGPHHCMWKATTTLKKMEETKRYLDEVFKS